MLDIEGFSILRHDRNRDGGGLVLYVHNTLKAEVLASSNTTIDTNTGKPNIPEYLVCSVQEGDAAPIHVAVIYRPPHVPWTKGTDIIEKLTSCAEDFSHKIIIFNANLLSNNGDAKFLKQLAKDLSLKIVEHGATHHKPDSHTWIDAILVDENDEILSAEN